MTATVAAKNHIIDVTDQTFQTEVIERSKTVPVVVDFWAAWCGPCRMLGPTLEKLAAEFDGAFVLAKIDVDRNPRYAQMFHVQGIPAVKAFRDGQVVNEFTGALPEPQVRQFLQGLAPSEADLLLKQAYEQEANDNLSQAEKIYRAAIDKQKDHYMAKVGLGRVLLQQGELEEGLEILASIPDPVPERKIADALVAQAQFQRHAVGRTEEELKAKIEADPKDVASRYALANLYAAQQKFVQALEQFLEVIRRDRQYDDDGARRAMLALFTIIGENSEITKSYRQQLANALF